MTPVTPRERLIATIARLLAGVPHVAVGASSPVPAAAAMLVRSAREAAGGEAVRLSILGSVEHDFFTNGSAELFDCAGQGCIDAFFLGGGQIDGGANVNLAGAGGHPRSKVRWPGSFGSSHLHFVVPRVNLFRAEHSTRVQVEKLDFISAPGTSPAGVHRSGGPHALVTSLALFSFDRVQGRFRLESTHNDDSVEDIRAVTGFDFDAAATVAATPDPDATTPGFLRGRVLDELEETYPHFARQMRADLEGAGT